MNRLGISISYDELERIDFTLANRLLNRLGEHRVPISNSIKKGLLHGAMDNFDHIKDTKSGKGSSHDTILMVFQNQNENNEEHVSTPIEQDIVKKRSVETVLECKFSRADIANDFIPGSYNVPENIRKILLEEYDAWCISRHVKPTLSNSEIKKIPSFIGIKSLLSTERVTLTTCAFTPILPYPATQYGTIYTCMKNFQDILKQRELPYGPLWCDPDVYRIAKEIQLLKSDEFDNIFVGLGGFHTEKVVLACIGKYLEGSGAEEILVQTGCFGPDTVEAVMNGGHYNRAKRGLNLLLCF